MKFIGLNSLLGSVEISKLFISLFLLTNIGLYYDNMRSLIFLGQFLLFVVVIIKLKNFRVNKDIGFATGIFIFFTFALMSVFWSNNASLTLQSIFLLGKCVALAICLVIVIKDINDLKLVYAMLAISGLIYGILFIENLSLNDVSSGRLKTYDDTIPNVNVVASTLMFSVIYFFSVLLKTKSKFISLLFIASVVVIFLLGSRRAIIFSVVGVLAIAYKNIKFNNIGLIFLLVISIVLIFNIIPDDYSNYIFGKFNGLLTLSKLDDSDELRRNLLTAGLRYFIESPILGSGYYAFSSKYLQDYYESYYAHNNYIETLVGVGLIGFVAYYGIYFLIIRNCLLLLKTKNLTQDSDFLYLTVVILFAWLGGQLFITLSNDRFTWMLLAATSCVTPVLKKCR